MGLRALTPRQDNVTPEDFLVFIDKRINLPTPLQVLRTDREYVYARDEKGKEQRMPYDFAIVLKSDGSYLIGTRLRNG